MRRHQTETIQSLLHEYLREEGLETPLGEHRIVEAWPQVVGPAIASYTGRIFVRNGVLNVEIRSASLRQNLMMTQSVLTRKLNDHVGQQVISSIRFF